MSREMPREDLARRTTSVVALAITLAGCIADDTATPPAEQRRGVASLALTTGFRLPLRCEVATTVTQGNQTSFSHVGEAAYGFDFGVPLDTVLVAARAGRVTFARNDVKPGNPCYSSGGPSCVSTLNYVTIDHGDGSSTLYAHLDATRVTVGQTVRQGDVIGLSGGTGWSTGPHTHLQRQKNCGVFVCQSIPMAFEDVPGDGVPVSGQAVKSRNGCDADCALGDGYYCGGNGVAGDRGTLFRCTAGKPAAVERCASGCAPMPPGVEDRCAIASETPAPAATTEPSPSPSASSTVAPGVDERPPRAAAEEPAGCAVRGRHAASPALAAATVAALLVLARRRSRRARPSVPD